MFRLCGTVLDQEVATARRDLVLSIWALVLEKQLPVTTVHYNALLRVHLENRHKFDPLAVLEDMKQAGAEPDRETYQCLISRHCQVRPPPAPCVTPPPADWGHRRSRQGPPEDEGLWYQGQREHL